MGIFEDARGKLKQAVGDLTDNDALKLEGEAQVAKGAEEREQTAARAAAKRHDVTADIQKKDQEAVQL
jgi:uncharacterized protein YjbJ (UPF0337 family)